MLRSDYVDRIIEIMKEDDGQLEYITRLDLNNYLETIIRYERQDAYNEGVEDTKTQYNY